MKVVWITLIFKIENNKIKVLRLYSEVRVVDAKLSLQKCLNFLNNIAMFSHNYNTFNGVEVDPNLVT